MNQWQPIETAPRDGTTVLLFKHTDPCWSFAVTAWWFGGDSWLSGWIACGIPHGEQNNLGLATHWMPPLSFPQHEQP